ncbi:hypothetical protein WJ972_28565 [Achromobacter insuavis]
MRARPDGDQAYAAGDGLPEAARLYVAAAVDYRSAAQAPDEPRLERARQRLLAILALPAEQAATRSVWAAYLLAEIGDIGTTPATEHPAQAYARVRELARQGAPDPWAWPSPATGRKRACRCPAAWANAPTKTCSTPRPAWMRSRRPTCSGPCACMPPRPRASRSAAANRYA